MNDLERIRGVHIVTDKLAVAQAPIPRDLIESVELALEGGAVLVQHRDLEATTEQRVVVGTKLREITSSRGVLYIANGDVDAAVKTEADGIHIRWSDGDPLEIRERMGPDKILGITIDGFDLEQVRRAEAAQATYIGITYHASKKTKPEAVPVGPEGFRRIREETETAIVAIGGINKNNIMEVFDAGAHAVAVVGAALRTVNPKYATRLLVARTKLVNTGK